MPRPRNGLAESLRSGHRVIVNDRLVERSFTATRANCRGEAIRRREVVIDEICVAFATATVTWATDTAADAPR